MIDFDREFKNMSKDDLIYLLGCYNNYVIDLIDSIVGEDRNNIINSSVSVYDFYENEYQDILKEEE